LKSRAPRHYQSIDWFFELRRHNPIYFIYQFPGVCSDCDAPRLFGFLGFLRHKLAHSQIATMSSSQCCRNPGRGPLPKKKWENGGRPANSPKFGRDHVARGSLGLSIKISCQVGPSPPRVQCAQVSVALGVHAQGRTRRTRLA